MKVNPNDACKTERFCKSLIAAITFHTVYSNPAPPGKLSFLTGFSCHNFTQKKHVNCMKHKSWQLLFFISHPDQLLGADGQEREARRWLSRQQPEALALTQIHTGLQPVPCGREHGRLHLQPQQDPWAELRPLFLSPHPTLPHAPPQLSGRWVLSPAPSVNGCLFILSLYQSGLWFPAVPLDAHNNPTALGTASFGKSQTHKSWTSCWSLGNIQIISRSVAVHDFWIWIELKLDFATLRCK